MADRQAAPSLDEAIDELIAEGEENPDEFADKLRQRHGETWMTTQLLAHIDAHMEEILAARVWRIVRARHEQARVKGTR